MANILISRVRDGDGIPLPSYKTAGAACVDLYAHVDPEGMELYPRVPRIVPTGIAVALPVSMEAQVRPRSGIALKHGVTVINAPGTIDSDYRGEICALMINHSDRTFTIEHGMRIAQLAFAPVIRVDWNEVETLPGTQRGSGGFGSTGV